jgi:hypothetical protein
MKKLLTILLFTATLGCTQCKTQDVPNIRTQPGIEYCGQMCKKLTDLQCNGYYEDLSIDCSKDGVYQTWKKCKDALSLDASVIVKMTCQEFCEYEMNNSVQLNPKCLADNLKDCSQIEKICK